MARIHNLGHENEINLNLLELIPEYPMGTLSLLAKFQLSSCSKLGVMTILILT